MIRRAAVLGTCAAFACLDPGAANAQFAPSWQGFYVGLTVGFAHSKATIDPSDLAIAGITSPNSVTGLSPNGASIGFAGGYNWQSGSLVFGVEADWSRLALRTSLPFSGTIPPFGAVSGTLGADLDWIASARARAGISLGQALVYGTVGLAVAGANGEVVVLGVGSPAAFSDSAWLAGWVLGGGIEYALSPVWTIKGELIRLHVGSGPFSSTAGAVPLSSRIDVYNVRAGLNYRF
ncbi:MAG TPA: outer membrane beta-barrel protein [Xanthobacteraceae bacterium]|jgi:outer membrane immunogenic protein